MNRCQRSGRLQAAKESLAPLTACILLSLCPGTARAQLQVTASDGPARVFAGPARPVSILLHNPGRQPVKADLQTRLYQASSSLALPLASAPWKQLEVLPGQTVVESIVLSFPPVRAETRFLIQWLEGTNVVLGATAAVVYPPDLLKELRLLAQEEPLGVFDPLNQLKPLLKAVAVEFEDLQETGLDRFVGKLALLGPFSARNQMPEDLAVRVKTLADKGAAVVWLQPPPEPNATLAPSFYLVPEGKGRVVVAQAALVARLPESPPAQLNLLRLARQACRPTAWKLPE